ncbi:hypothetical protein J1614_001594 [Plenodomus biglobosus]|nr:hypothetical protein J1614_001594 [Plenodomus biglobosus]
MSSLASELGKLSLHVHEESIPNTEIVSLSQLERVEELEKGGEGVVEAWKHSLTGALIAVKIVSRWRSTKGEVEILLDLPPHKHIIKCLGYVDKHPSLTQSSILLEYCPGGDLFHLHARNMERNDYTGTFSEAFMWSTYIQIAGAIAFLHEGIDPQHTIGRDNWRTIMHRDLKTENILIKSMGFRDDMSDVQVKLGDFGAARFYDRTSKIHSQNFGTTTSWPPEMMESNGRGARHYSPPCDVWGVGAIIHDLAHTLHPIVTPCHVRHLWLASGNKRPYPEGWSASRKMNYWAARAPRRVIPLNLQPDAPLPAFAEFLGSSDDPIAVSIRRHRPCPKYSDYLNNCMMLALNMDPKGRMCAGELWTTILELHSDYLIEQLNLQHDQHLRELANDGPL